MRFLVLSLLRAFFLLISNNGIRTIDTRDPSIEMVPLSSKPKLWRQVSQNPRFCFLERVSHDYEDHSVIKP